jgi:hypothetical protein
VLLIINEILTNFKVTVEYELCCLFGVHIVEELVNYGDNTDGDNSEEEGLSEPKTLEQLFLDNNLLSFLPQTTGCVKTNMSIL